MPFFQRLIERANPLFDRAHVADLSPQIFEFSGEPAEILGTLAQNLGLEPVDAERTYLRTWPPLLQETIRTVLRASVQVSRSVGSPGGRRPVTMAWTPGYDYSVTVWESRSTAQSAGAVTMVLTSPYPDDEAAVHAAR